MKTVETEIEGTIFKVQEGLSFTQQSMIIGIMEEHINIDELYKLQDQDELSIESIKTIIKKGKSLIEFNYAIMKYLLTNIVVEPNITDEMLDDPDDPNALSYLLLGTKLSELALIYLGRMNLLKKTPKS